MAGRRRKALLKSVRLRLDGVPRELRIYISWSDFMEYHPDGRRICVGDTVLVEGNIKGVVVCDFDHRQCRAGYEAWMSTEEMLGGGHLSTGVMIETAEIGMVHYASPDADVVFLARAEAGRDDEWT